MRPETPAYRPPEPTPATPAAAGPWPGGIPTPSVEPRAAAPAAGRPGWNPTPAAASTPTVKHAAPLPKRPKGRLFVGTMLLALFATVGYFIATTFLAYGTYGTVVGRVVRVSPPWDGIVRTKFVRDGDSVHEGQLLAIVERPELARQVDRTTDELHLSVAELDAEMAQLKWEHQVLGERREKASADYYETWGNLLREESLLDALAQQLARSRQLKQRQATSDAEYEAVELAESGQRAKVEKIQTALERLKQRAELTEADLSLQETRLRPKRERIETLRRELTRLRREIDSGELRAPVAGKVLRSNFFTGEQASTESPLVELLAEGSVELVLFVEQEKLAEFTPGATAYVHVAPRSAPISAVILRLGDEFATIPAALERNYRRDQAVLPVYLRPDHATDEDELRLGAEVRLPRELPKLELPEFMQRWKWFSQRTTRAPSVAELARVRALRNCNTPELWRVRLQGDQAESAL